MDYQPTNSMYKFTMRKASLASPVSPTPRSDTSRTVSRPPNPKFSSRHPPPPAIDTRTGDADDWDKKASPWHFLDVGSMSSSVCGHDHQSPLPQVNQSQVSRPFPSPRTESLSGQKLKHELSESPSSAYNSEKIHAFNPLREFGAPPSPPAPYSPAPLTNNIKQYHTSDARRSVAFGYSSSISTSPAAVAPKSSLTARRTMIERFRQTMNNVTATEYGFTAPEEQSPLIFPPRSSSKRPYAEELPKDLRRGWVTVFASFLIHAVVLGIQNTWGIYQATYSKQGVANTSLLALIGSLSAGLMPGFAFVAGTISLRIGYRLTVSMGTIMIISGLVGASFSKSYWVICACQGVIYGLGASLCWFPAVVSPGLWFDKYRGIAMGIASAGTAVGGSGLTFLTRGLIDHYDGDVAWPLRIIAMGSLVVLAIAIALIDSRVDSSPAKPSYKPVKMDWKFFKDRRFILMFLISVLNVVGFLIPIHFLAVFGQAIKLEDSKSTILIAVYNGISGVGRIVAGILADAYFGYTNSLFMCMFFGALAILGLWSIAWNFAMMMCFVVLQGFMSGGFISLFSVVIGQVFGQDKVTSIGGFIYAGMAVGILAGSPVAGAIVDAEGRSGQAKYLPAILYGGSSLMAAAILVFVLKLWQRKGLFVKV